MNHDTLHLELIKFQIAALPQEQRLEVAKLLAQIQELIKSASDTTVASATVALFGAIANASWRSAQQMPTDGGTH